MISKVFIFLSSLLLAIALQGPAGAVSAKVETQSAFQTLLVDGKVAEEVWLNTAQGKFRFTAEIADTEEERSMGLMFREEMTSNHGMLFDFERKRRIQMWMRNTPLSLDMVFLNEKGEVVKITERTTPFSDAIIDSGEPITHVLEINAGVSRLVGLKVGDAIEHPMFIKE